MTTLYYDFSTLPTVEQIRVLATRLSDYGQAYVNSSTCAHSIRVYHTDTDTIWTCYYNGLVGTLYMESEKGQNRTLSFYPEMSTIDYDDLPTLDDALNNNGFYEIRNIDY